MNAKTRDPNTPSNADRCAWAQVIISHYRALVGDDDDQTSAVDLLADLRHWADKRGLDFDQLNATAETHYQEEKE
jgi:hypothetical protein